MSIAFWVVIAVSIAVRLVGLTKPAPMLMRVAGLFLIDVIIIAGALVGAFAYAARSIDARWFQQRHSTSQSLGAPSNYALNPPVLRVTALAKTATAAPLVPRVSAGRWADLIGPFSGN
jgi:Na+-translocating ferredoxin:NAD+ oxidoreductase RnfA subunit